MTTTMFEPVDGRHVADTPEPEGRHRATYHGIAYAKCLTCGAESRDASTLELWNDYGVSCLTNQCTGDSVWELVDGSRATIANDGTLLSTNPDAPRV